ncbi:hypothetical protein DICPUDRAFT_78209 [Dictyostelium purpureum]|uniref:Roadblock/LAMTOR2 domain-containing protein n=1 Tax=Dictyostelium purpureum TaxID=5786 RepID=F0ZIW1_DICPU|nr:uncharacterized protein DICPUDRAFT_78209 [Dictyostelium purpureum]EGC36111.1 hypothetical protein DICPUDRAFT_78209 [Dictyostelium purpureum]|eukprot:XP_003287368.1 hypothetical protein DICPUDRAFT_78209 [Dictyostelium purpureum]
MNIDEFLNHIKTNVLDVTIPDTSIILSDRDGFVLGKNIDKNSSVDNVVDSSLLSTFSSCTDQASKLHAGSNKSIVSYFNDRIVVHIIVSNVILSIVTDTDANVGLILGTQNDLISSLKNLSQSIQVDIQDM